LVHTLGTALFLMIEIQINQTQPCFIGLCKAEWEENCWYRSKQNLPSPIPIFQGT
jgi:hypothetical protein